MYIASFFDATKKQFLAMEFDRQPHLEVALEDTVDVDVDGATAEDVRNDDDGVAVLHIYGDGLLAFTHGYHYCLLLRAFHVHIHRGHACINGDVAAFHKHVDGDECAVEDRHGRIHMCQGRHKEEAEEEKCLS